MYIVTPSPGQNLVDWKIYKAIVFESDDWGLCGWSSDLETFNTLYARHQKKVTWYKSTLEAPDDLERLFNILLKYRGGDGRPVVFQPAYIVANPDYETIEASGYAVYADLVIPDVPSRWQRGDFIAKAKEGIKKGVWHPIYHGNSHFNRFEWMQRVQASDPSTVRAFKYQTFINEHNTDYDEYGSELTTDQQELSISTGIKRFYDVFGYHPKAAIAPTYVWQNKTERLLAKNGIQAIAGKRNQQITRSFFTEIGGKLINRAGRKVSDRPRQISTGDYNAALKLYYLNRKAYFEPFRKQDARRTAEGAYKDIINAWEGDEPAIVCTHRINYVYLDDNRVLENLNQLDCLLQMIQTRHPEAVYLTDWEVVQLYSTGTSTMQYYDSILCRNYTSCQQKIKVTVPPNYRVKHVMNLRKKRKTHYFLEKEYLSLEIEAGDYEVVLYKEA